MRPVGQVGKASTHLQIHKRTDGDKIINQLIVELNSLKYVCGACLKNKLKLLFLIHLKYIASLI